MGFICGLLDAAGKGHSEFQNDLLRDQLVQFPHFLKQGGPEKYQVPHW